MTKSIRLMVAAVIGLVAMASVGCGRHDDIGFRVGKGDEDRGGVGSTSVVEDDGEAGWEAPDAIAFQSATAADADHVKVTLAHRGRWAAIVGARRYAAKTPWVQGVLREPTAAIPMAVADRPAELVALTSTPTSAAPQFPVQRWSVRRGDRVETNDAVVTFRVLRHLAAVWGVRPSDGRIVLILATPVDALADIPLKDVELAADRKLYEELKK